MSCSTVRATFRAREIAARSKALKHRATASVARYLGAAPSADFNPGKELDMSGDIATLPPPSLQAMIEELDRELTTRERVYPKWINQGKIRRPTANYRVHVMTAIRDKLVDELAEQRSAEV